MESNQSKMITPTRFIAFLVLIISGIVALVSGKGSESDMYVPSEAIVQAIEGGEDALKLCEDGRDSFYVMLSNFNNDEFITQKESVKEVLKFLDVTIDKIYSFNLSVDYFYLKHSLKDSFDLDNSIVKDEFDKVFLRYPANNCNYKEFIEFCSANRYKTNINLDLIFEKIYNQIPKDSLADLGQLCLDEAFHLKTKMLFEKSLDKALLAKKYFKKDSVKFSRLYSQALSLIADLHYDMEEYSLSYPFYKRAISHTRKNYDNKEALERIMYNSCVMIVNHYNEIDSLDSLQQIIFVETALNEYKDQFKTDLSEFRYNFLNGIWYYNRYEDSIANKYYSIACNYSNEEGSNVSKMQWLDVHVQNINPLSYLNRHDDALDIIKVIRKKFPEIDSISVFKNFVLAQARIKELVLQGKMAINSSSSEKLEITLNDVNNFISLFELNNLNINPDNIYYINNNFSSIFEVKIELLNALMVNNPSEVNKARLFLEIDKLKSKEQFYKKISRNKEDYGRLIYLMKRELETKDSDQNKSILDSLKSEYPEYYKLKFNGPLEFLDGLQEYCATNNTDILEYYADDINLAFVVTPFDLKAIPVEIDYSLLEGFHSTLNKDSLASYHFWSDTIFQTIYKPVAENLKSKNLIIISDGLVDNLSFESFKVNDNYLAQSKIISYAYSAKSLLVESKEVIKYFEEKSLIAFSYTDSETYKNQKKPNLPELLGGYNECIALKKMFPNQVDIFAGYEATKDHFLRNAFNYDIIHLAMHGASEGKSIKSNKLYFRSENDIDILKANEFQNLINPRTNLMVLSACQTNFAKNIVNEGNLSMAKYFSTIGIENLITSTWDINDNSTSELMQSFYLYYSKHNNVSEALSKAKNEYYNNNIDELQSHPFYWASLKYYRS